MLNGRAGGVKNRNASKWVHRTGSDSTTRSVSSAPSRSGQASCRTDEARYTIAHSCSPKHPSRGARAAVAVSSERMNRTVGSRVGTTGPSVTPDGTDRYAGHRRYERASSPRSTTPGPGCQRSSRAGRWV